MGFPVVQLLLLNNSIIHKDLDYQTCIRNSGRFHIHEIAFVWHILYRTCYIFKEKPCTHPPARQTDYPARQDRQFVSAAFPENRKRRRSSENELGLLLSLLRSHSRSPSPLEFLRRSSFTQSERSLSVAKCEIGFLKVCAS